MDDEEKEYYLPVSETEINVVGTEQGRMSTKRPFLKLEFWSNPKVIGAVSLAWVLVLLVYLGRGIVCFYSFLWYLVYIEFVLIFVLCSQLYCVLQVVKQKQEAKYTSHPSKQ